MRARTSKTDSSPIGKTWWWAKRKVFGFFLLDPDISVHVDFIFYRMKATDLVSAHGFIEALIKWKMVLILRIFEQTSPLAENLQTEGTDMLSVQRMVRTTHECLETLSL